MKFKQYSECKKTDQGSAFGVKLTESVTRQIRLHLTSVLENYLTYSQFENMTTSLQLGQTNFTTKRAQWSIMDLY